MTTGKQPYGREVAASTLEELGKTAARLAKTSGINLTEAATQTLKTASLNAEQVRRAVEYCNIAAVNDKYASLSGSNRIVDISGGPADPAQVIQSLKSAQAVPDVRIDALEYSLPPQGEKRSSGILPKVAMAQNLIELRDKLAAAHEELTAEADSAKFEMQTMFSELRCVVKQAGLQGVTSAELLRAWVRQDQELAKVASANLGFVADPGSSCRTLNPDHPVMAYFGSFVKSAQRYKQATVARQDVENHLRRVENHLRGVA